MKPALENAVQALQRDLVEHHPDDAVRLLEREDPEDVAALLASHPISATLWVWERLSPDIGIRALEAMTTEAAGEVLRSMDPSRAAAMLAMRDTEARETFLTLLSQSDADELRAILSYPADSAGALMDPRMLLFRAETTVDYYDREKT